MPMLPEETPLPEMLEVPFTPKSEQEALDELDCLDVEFMFLESERDAPDDSCACFGSCPEE